MPRRRSPILPPDAELERIFALLARHGHDVRAATRVDIRADGVTITTPRGQASAGATGAYDEWQNMDAHRARPAHS